MSHIQFIPQLLLMLQYNLYGSKFICENMICLKYSFAFAIQIIPQHHANGIA